MNQNQLDGPIPFARADLSNLLALNVDSKHLEGSIPPGLVSLVNLKWQNLNYSRLTGVTPTGLDAPPKLESLPLDNYQFAGDSSSDAGSAL